MTTEKKKKRIPKPLPNGATRFLLDYALPFLGLNWLEIGKEIFLNSENPEEIKCIAEKIFPSVAIPLSKMQEHNQESIDRQMSELWVNPQSLYHLLYTASGCRKMIEIATKEKAGNMVNLPGNYRETGLAGANESLEGWINRSLSKMAPIVSWTKNNSQIKFKSYDYNKLPGKGTQADIFNSELDGFRGRLIMIISESFSTWNGEKANGIFFIGCCPRCGKIFEKKRNNQEYDRNTCRNEFTRKK